MNKKRKKFTSLFLVFSLVALSGSLIGKERKGAKLAIQKKNGQQVMGELITVKPDSLLLLDSENKEGIEVLLVEFRLPELEPGKYSMEIIAEEMTTQTRSQVSRTFKIR